MYKIENFQNLTKERRNDKRLKKNTNKANESEHTSDTSVAQL